ncbi:MAG: hypothetical protein V3U17_05450, partial [Thermoplasmata archaeon]
LNHRKPAAVLLMDGDSGRRLIQAETAVVDFTEKRTGIRALDIEHQEKQVGDAGLREDLSTTPTSTGGPFRETWQVEKLDLGPSVGKNPRHRPEGREVVVPDLTRGLGNEVQKRTLADAWVPRDSYCRVARLPDAPPFPSRPFGMLGLFTKLRQFGSKTAHMFLGRLVEWGSPNLLLDLLDLRLRRGQRPLMLREQEIVIANGRPVTPKPLAG